MRHGALGDARAPRGGCSRPHGPARARAVRPAGASLPACRRQHRPCTLARALPPQEQPPATPAPTVEGGGGASPPRLGSAVELALHGDWWGRLLGRQPEAEGSMPQVRVDLGDAVRVPIFQLLYDLYIRHGPIFRMSLGPKSFFVVSDPACVRQILVGSVDKYGKGILAEILEFVMGQGLLAADGEVWVARRRVVAPALHRKFVASQVALFGASAQHGLPQLQAAAASGGSVEMESFFSRLSLDIIGKSVFDYDFDSMTHDDPVIQAVYAVLREAESRSTAPFPYWKLPGAALLVPRLRTSAAALQVVNATLDRLVARCKQLVDAEDAEFSEDYNGISVLHFLLASGQDISSRALRDDLMTLLIAGHETTAAALTWALHLLVQNPEAVGRIRAEVDSVLGDRLPAAEDLAGLRYTTRCVHEALRLYPQPPVLIRRALEDDVLCGQHAVPAGSDLFISVYNLQRSPQLWDEPEAFRPERFGPLDGPAPSESTTDFRYLPFGGGRRKCVGDQFAIMECVVALAVLLRRYDFRPDPSKPPVGVTTGATIHTSAGLHMLVTDRDLSNVPPPLPRSASAPDSSAVGCPHAAAAAAVAAASGPSAACPMGGAP